MASFDLPILGAPISRRTMLAASIFGAAAPALAKADDDPLERFLKKQLEGAAIPGMAVGVARAGKVTLMRGYGFADIAQHRQVTTNTMFHLASVTKTVTATAIMMLVEAGHIDLDAPISGYLDFKVINPAHPDSAITVRHLLTHVSSLSDQTYYQVDFRTIGMDSPLPLRAFLTDYLVSGGAYYTAAGCFSSAAPGAVYDYCNVGYALLGYIVEQVAGQDLRAFTHERMSTPLGMRPVSWRIADVPPQLAATPYEVVDGRAVATPAVGFPDYPVGMLRASIASFMPFVAAAANGGAFDKARILSSANQAQMLTMTVPPGLPSWVSGQGLGWMESNNHGKRLINHWGGDPGVFTAVYLDPVTTTGVAIFTNMSATPASKNAIKSIAEHLLTGPLA